MFIITQMRHRRLKSRPFPDEWQKHLQRNVPLYLRLPEADRKELQGYIQVFVAEKSFEGGGGFVITDEVRVTIAAQACLLLLHRKTGYYPGLSSIIVYPGEYIAPQRLMDEAGIVTEGTDRRSGETSIEGALVLSWEDVLREELEVHEAYNVVLHEFAHQLDAEEGITSVPAEESRWTLTAILEQEFLKHQRDVDGNRRTLIDPYGAEDLAEFFAVTTECFFEQPRPLRERHPELYDELAHYYRQDPAEWPELAPQ